MIGQNAAYEASADIPDYDFELDDIQYDEMIFKALYKENTIEPHNNDTIEVIDKFIAEANEKYINESLGEGFDHTNVDWQHIENDLNWLLDLYNDEISCEDDAYNSDLDHPTTPSTFCGDSPRSSNGSDDFL
eukprot:GHVL01004246.1.p1 GENE.GHVL01004246.1~~GHVL01004246.1.p1  ORF type:complete len:132 (-),score=30.74 GHVL01004246.1:93-488(-)